jgi:hypothetical protein
MLTVEIGVNTESRNGKPKTVKPEPSRKLPTIVRNA